jgi:hypothetical protein
MSEDAVAAQLRHRAERDTAKAATSGILHRPPLSVLLGHTEPTNSPQLAAGIRADRQQEHDEYFAPEQVAARRARWEAEERVRVALFADHDGDGVRDHSTSPAPEVLADSRLKDALEHEAVREHMLAKPHPDEIAEGV